MAPSQSAAKEKRRCYRANEHRHDDNVESPPTNRKDKISMGRQKPRHQKDQKYKAKTKNH
jgi:hypothetical protein